MKYHVIIEGIDPPPDRELQFHTDHIHWCRQWSKANLDALENTPRYDNAEAVVYENNPVVVERIKRVVNREATLEEKVVAIVEEIGMSITKNGETPLSPVEIVAKLQLALERVKGKQG